MAALAADEQAVERVVVIAKRPKRSAMASVVAPQSWTAMYSEDAFVSGLIAAVHSSYSRAIDKHGFRKHLPVQSGPFQRLAQGEHPQQSSSRHHGVLTESKHGLHPGIREFHLAHREFRPAGVEILHGSNARPSIQKGPERFSHAYSYGRDHARARYEDSVLHLRVRLISSCFSRCSRPSKPQT